jgi:hypothetical protein
MNSLVKDWRQLLHGTISINNKQNLDSMLYADDQVLTESEDNLQLSSHNLNKFAKIYDIEMSHEKGKVFSFRGKYPVTRKICLNNKLLERVNSFSYLGYSLSFTHDTQTSRTKY